MRGSGSALLPISVDDRGRGGATHPETAKEVVAGLAPMGARRGAVVSLDSVSCGERSFDVLSGRLWGSVRLFLFFFFFFFFFSAG